MSTPIAKTPQQILDEQSAANFASSHTPAEVAAEAARKNAVPATPPAPTNTGVLPSPEDTRASQGLPRIAPATPQAPTDNFGTAGKTFAEVKKSAYEDLLGQSKSSLDNINKTYEDVLTKKRA